jgi:hypothetical protein
MQCELQDSTTEKAWDAASAAGSLFRDALSGYVQTGAIVANNASHIENSVIGSASLISAGAAHPSIAGTNTPPPLSVNLPLSTGTVVKLSLEDAAPGCLTQRSQR